MKPTFYFLFLMEIKPRHNFLQSNLSIEFLGSIFCKGMGPRKFMDSFNLDFKKCI